MTGLQGKTKLNCELIASGTVNTLPATGRVNYSAGSAYSYGTGTGQANQVYSAVLTITASSSTTLTLRGGSIVNPINEVAEFQTIKEIIIDLAESLNSGTQASSVEVGNAATPFVGPFSGGTVTMEVLKNGKLAVGGSTCAGWSCSAGMQLKIANNDAVNSAIVRVVIIGIKP